MPTYLDSEIKGKLKSSMDVRKRQKPMGRQN